MRHSDVVRISVKELSIRLGGVGLIVFDVRSNKDWSGAGEKIQGAVREAPNDVEQWMWDYPRDKTLVFYCASTLEGTSASVAQKFLDRRYERVYALEGGWKEWTGAGLPVDKIEEPVD